MYAWPTDDVARDARLIKPLLAARVAQPPGMSLPYPDLPHARDWGAAVAACSWISDEQALAFVERHCLFGAPVEIRRGLDERWHRFGIQKFLLHGLMSYELPHELIAAASSGS